MMKYSLLASLAIAAAASSACFAVERIPSLGVTHEHTVNATLKLAPNLPLPIVGVHWSADGRYVLARASYGSFQVVDTRNGYSTDTLNLEGETAAADWVLGERVFLAFKDGRAAIWDRTLSEPSFEFQGKQRITLASIDRRGEWIGLGANLVNVANANSTAVDEHIFQTASGFSNSGHFFTAGLRDGRVRLWVPGRSAPTEFRETASVTSAAIRHDGTSLAIATDAGEIRVYQTAHIDEPRRIELSGDATWLSYSTDDSRLIYLADRHIGVHDTGTLRSIARFRVSDEQVTAVDTSQGLVAAGDAGGRIVLWSISTNEPVGQATVGDSAIQSIALHPAERRMVVGLVSGEMIFLRF